MLPDATDVYDRLVRFRDFIANGNQKIKLLPKFCLSGFGTRIFQDFECLLLRCFAYAQFDQIIAWRCSWPGYATGPQDHAVEFFRIGVAHIPGKKVAAFFQFRQFIGVFFCFGRKLADELAVGLVISKLNFNGIEWLFLQVKMRQYTAGVIQTLFFDGIFVLKPAHAVAGYRFVEVKF